MKYTLLLLTTLLFLSINTHAQRTKVETSITGGYIEQLAPSGRGWHGGLNFYARAPKKLKLDIQFSINNANDRDEMGSHFAINGLAGVRYYITNPKKTAKVYCNALIGPAYILELDYDYYYATTPFGYTAGIFVNNNSFITGISVESYQNLIFKIGYAF